MDDVEMVGHCDVDESRAEDAAARYGGKAFTEHRVMYDAVKPQVVYVAVPPYAHGDVEEAAIERGVHLFIEKPISNDRATAGRIAKALRRSNCICSVGYCYRYYDTAVTARKLLKGQAISLISGVWSSGMPEVWWWRCMDKSGGQVVEQTTHLIDLLRFLCGDVAEVYAVGSTGCMTQLKDYDVHDSSVLSLRMKTGATASVVSSCVAGYNGSVSLSVLTPDASFRFSQGTLSITENGKSTEYRSNTDVYAEEDRCFLDAVRTGRKTKIRSSYTDAVKTFAVTDAANESMRSGLPVKV